MYVGGSNIGGIFFIQFLDVSDKSRKKFKKNFYRFRQKNFSRQNFFFPSFPFSKIRSDDFQHWVGRKGGGKKHTLPPPR